MSRNIEKRIINNSKATVIVKTNQIFRYYMQKLKPVYIKTPIVNFIARPYFSVFRSDSKSRGALSHDSIDQSKLTATMADINDAQLSKDFDGLCLAKGILIFALSPAVIHSIASSVVLSIYLHRKQLEYKISILHLLVYF